jgi:hypothetical protein
MSALSVRQQLKDSYSETGRPSVDPELLLRILLIGYLYGITSERKLVEELRMHPSSDSIRRPSQRAARSHKPERSRE